MAQKQRPQNRREFMSKLVKPTSPEQSVPEKPFSEPYKPGQPEIPRAFEVSFKQDNQPIFNIGIKDIDESIRYYFENVLRLSVTQNGKSIKVPLRYANPENWNAIQRDGFLRDKDGKILAPLIVFKRVDLNQNRNLGYKLDGNISRNVYYFPKPKSKRNYYTRLDFLQQRNEEKEYMVVVVPDYVTVTYECKIWTNYVEQMDKIIEAINFSSRSYWGDKSKFQFYADIESFSDEISYEIGEDRIVSNTFQVKLNGYLIPDSVNRELSALKKVYGVSKITFGLEVAGTSQELYDIKTSKIGKKSNVAVNDSKNVISNQTVINNYGGPGPEVYEYILYTKESSGTYIDNVTMRFSAWRAAPSGIPATSEAQFKFFVNGQYLEDSAIVSFSESSGYSYLVIDPIALGFEFSSSDEVVGIGKFL